MVVNICYILLGNELVLIVLKDSKIIKVEIDKKIDWKKLLEGGCLVVGDFDYVFVGIYVKELLENLGVWVILVLEMV